MAAATSLPAANNPQAAKPSLKKVAVEVVIVTFLAAAIGVASSMMPGQASHGSAKTEDAAPPPRAATESLFNLPPIVTNVAAPADTWIRLEASVVFAPDAGPHSEAVGAEIAGDILAYLRTVSLAQLEGPIGLQNIRQDLSERASIRSGGKVTAFLIRTLVVQ